MRKTLLMFLATAFAAELLMPPELFMSMWLDFRDLAPDPGYRVEVVAREFDVSPAAATVRVSALRLMEMEERREGHRKEVDGGRRDASDC